jgi:hypothetical protein
MDGCGQQRRQLAPGSRARSVDDERSSVRDQKVIGNMQSNSSFHGTCKLKRLCNHAAHRQIEVSVNQPTHS